jgi:polyisoprenoid-binding protein YceI
MMAGGVRVSEMPLDIQKRQETEMIEMNTAVAGATPEIAIRDRMRTWNRRVLRTAVASIPLVIATLVAAPALAQTQWHIDPAKSTVAFSLKGFHDVAGHFAVSSGEVTFDRATGAMSGTIVVPADSGNSDDKSRDKKMDKDQLKVTSYPTITFSPAKFTGTLHAEGSSNIQVQGVFTLLGKPHDITVPMTVGIDGTDCTAKGSFEIPYVEWHMKDPSNFLMKMDKQVKIDLAFSGTLSH